MPAFPLPLSGDLGARPTRVGGVRGSGAVVLRRGGAPPMETGAPPGGPRAGIGDCRRGWGSFSFFARYYGLRPASTDRSLALGLCLYSCFRVLNDTISDRYLFDYAQLWSLLEMVAFFASLLLWTWALRRSQLGMAAEGKLLPLGVY